MAENTKIEWATHTFNPWFGCTAISRACDFCYAETWAKRSGLVQWGNHPRRLASDTNWRKPYKWAKQAQHAPPSNYSEASRFRPRVFCASLADVFDNQAPQEWRERLWQVIRDTPELDWLLLTKRPQNIMDMIPRVWQPGLPSHIWVGVTAENQTEYDRRMNYLQDVPASVHFVSYEPALGPLKIGHRSFPNWIICGGEDRVREGREMDLQWARDLRDECKPRGVAFYFKQTNGKSEIPPDLMVREFPRAT
ncbi:DUF5131 family protein [Bradyrhizobium sp. BRP22]|uniref:DUF5131 family protein n=1 Tax=Bradyrhizobium sp. BRP22 TaxID=2793821 RepID=UPI001CD6BB54|nr:DUF5131 family protein [Bradyrhizobium sp. BRP22]MCA1458039.1 DUF5131 family protein [Bradyrhizobium sp. BRP22]